eukprot:1193957-Prorocentrum_minimum.AAC.1
MGEYLTPIRSHMVSALGSCLYSDSCSDGPTGKKIFDCVQPGWTVLCLGLHPTEQYLARLSRRYTSLYGGRAAYWLCMLLYHQ